MTKSKKSRIIRASIGIVAVLSALFVVIPYSVTAIVLHVIFDRRYQTEDYLRFSVSDFDGLRSERHTVASKSGQTLVGYRYYTDNAQPKGVVIVSHGLGGGGQIGYLDVSYFFASHGYEVYAFDSSGNDESGGKVGGLQRAVIDLDSVISYVKERSELPIVLWGHSQGGYSSLCALAYHDIAAVASIASFHCASDIMEMRGVEYAGKASKLFLPYVRSVQRMQFGEYADDCAIEAAKHGTAAVFIAQGTDDLSIPVRYGYDAYYAEFADDTRFRFFKAEGKGHTDVLYSDEGLEYMLSLTSEIEACGSEKERREVIANIDRQKLCSCLDTELFGEIVAFYDRAVTASVVWHT